MRKMINGYRKQRKSLGEYIDVYLYIEQSKDHRCGLDLMTKWSMLNLRLESFGIERRLE